MGLTVLTEAAARARQRSVEVLLRQQQPSGAFAASPDFSQYGYCWLRDGSFIAYALDQSGEVHAAARFHHWCVRAIEGVMPRMAAAVGRRRHGKPVDVENVPPARFSLTGEPVRDDWPNFQIDGYGTWLWALGKHLEALNQPLPGEWTAVVRQTAEFLSAFVLEPCFDVWEENGDQVHTSTVGCAAAGIKSALSLLRSESGLDTGLADLEDALVQAGNQLTAAGQCGWYAKSNLRSEVDASTVWLSAPLSIVPPDDGVMARTVAQVERTLMFEGGIRRYAEDTYFGGGAWPVLTCSLGLHYVRTGRFDDAQRCLEWSVSHVDALGLLGEQYGGERRNPEKYRTWVRQWGPPARDLLWSHAMLALLATGLDA